MERIRVEGIDISHWTGPYIRKPALAGPKKPLRELSSARLRIRLISEGLLLEQCAGCGLFPEWLGNPLTLHLDHVDGNNKNNELANLRFLCPNCHQQTDTWGNKRSRKLPDDSRLLELTATHNYAEIAKLYDVHPSTVSHRLRRYYE